MKTCITLLMVSLLAVLFAGCGDESASTADTPVRIGAVYPFSGQQTAAGREIRQGIALAMEVINHPHPRLNLPLASGAGLPAFGGAPVRVIFADHQGLPEQARDETERLINEQRVIAVIGAYQSEQTRVASEVAEQAGIPFLNPDSTSPALTQRGLQWFFRTTPSDATFVEDAFHFITELNASRNAGLQTVALIHEGTDFGTGVSELVGTLAPQYGLQVVADVLSTGTAGDVPGQVMQVRDAQPDVVLFAVYATDAIRFIQEFKRQNYAPPLVWADDAGFIAQEYLQAVGADAAYVTSREVWSLDLTGTNALAAQVNTLYRARYGTDMNGNSARAFTGLITLADAINRAASTEPLAIRTALRATDIPADQLIMPWRGIRFDAAGQNTLGDGIIVQMLNGRYTTVWPDSIAAEPVVFPFPAWNAR
ncbi:MAG: ABC transporter substrate-binding protein [Armatimonadota bacterium]